MTKRILRWTVLLLLMAVSAFAENHYCVTTEQGVYLVSESGNAIDFSAAWTDLYCIQENSLYAVGQNRSGKMLYALCDASGRFLTEPIYTSLAAQQNGVLFLLDGVYGWMDDQGDEQIPADYTQMVGAGGNSFYAFLTDPNDDQADQIYLVDTANHSTPTGVWTILPLETVSDNRMPFCESGTAMYGYLDQKGAIAIPAQFEYAGTFENGLADAVENGLHGLIDTDGNWVLNHE